MNLGRWPLITHFQETLRIPSPDPMRCYNPYVRDDWVEALGIGVLSLGLVFSSLVR